MPPGRRRGRVGGLGGHGVSLPAPAAPGDHTSGSRSWRFGGIATARRASPAAPRFCRGCRIPSPACVCRRPGCSPRSCWTTRPPSGGGPMCAAGRNSAPRRTAGQVKNDDECGRGPGRVGAPGPNLPRRGSHRRPRTGPGPNPRGAGDPHARRARPGGRSGQIRGPAFSSVDRHRSDPVAATVQVGVSLDTQPLARRSTGPRCGRR